MLGYSFSKLLKPCWTSVSSAGVDDHPDTVSVIFPLSALAVDEFVFVGQAFRAFLGPLAPPPVPPVPPPLLPHAARTTDTSVSATSALNNCRAAPARNHLISSLLCHMRCFFASLTWIAHQCS